MYVDATSFVTCGSKHIKFWNLEKEKLGSRDGVFKKYPVQSFVSMALTAKGEKIGVGK